MKCFSCKKELEEDKYGYYCTNIKCEAAYLDQIKYIKSKEQKKLKEVISIE